MLKRLLAIGMAALPLYGKAQPAEMPPTLAEAWLAWQAHRHDAGQPPFDWAYAWALRERDAARLEDRFARLQAEMSALGAILETTGETALSRALASWSRRLSERSSSPGRSPEPLGLLHLAGDLRRNPAMADMRLLGSCQPPGWVEAWTLTGVRRIPWEPGMSLDEALATLSPAAVEGIEHAMVISPQGQAERVGIAAWNHQERPLAPGARLLTLLPERGLGGTREGDVINRELAYWLSTRLPGDDCTQWEVE